MQIQNLTEADLLPMMEVTMAPPWAMAREDMAAAHVARSCIRYKF